MRTTLMLGVALLSAGTARAQTRSEPQPAPSPPPIEAPRDVRFPGALKLEVDATDLDRRIFRFRESVPVGASGPMVLLYARWIPGHHSPTAEIRNFGGLTISAGGRALQWTRDTADTFAYHVDVPPGATSLEIEGQYLSATDDSQGSFMITHEMLRLSGSPPASLSGRQAARRIDVDASVRPRRLAGSCAALRDHGHRLGARRGSASCRSRRSSIRR
jgi:hypothetical protein